MVKQIAGKFTTSTVTRFPLKHSQCHCFYLSLLQRIRDNLEFAHKSARKMKTSDILSDAYSVAM